MKMKSIILKNIYACELFRKATNFTWDILSPGNIFSVFIIIFLIYFSWSFLISRTLHGKLPILKSYFFFFSSLFRHAISMMINTSCNWQERIYMKYLRKRFTGNLSHTWPVKLSVPQLSFWFIWTVKWLLFLWPYQLVVDWSWVLWRKRPEIIDLFFDL